MIFDRPKLGFGIRIVIGRARPGRAVEIDRVLHPQVHPWNSTRSSASGSTRSLEWNSLDHENWSAVGRTPNQISTVPNLPSLVPEMGQRQGHGHALKSVGRGSSATRQNRPIGMFYRCHLRGGKKGGPDVGPTKCGKGTKIMAAADRNGLPIAIYIAGASTHEAKLVERTLDHRFVRPTPGRRIGQELNPTLKNMS